MLRPITYAPQGHELVARAGVGFMDGLVQVPVVELQAADAERVVAALIGARDEAVERDGHVARCWCHLNQDHRLDEKSSAGERPRESNLLPFYERFQVVERFFKALG